MLVCLVAIALAGAPGDVVLGVSSADGASTDVSIGTRAGVRVVATIAHPPGEMPAGVVADGAVLATVPQGRGAARVERVPLDGSPARVLAGAAVPRQPPIPVAGGAAFLRPSADGAGPFDVVVVRDDQELIAASVEAAWLTPLRGTRALRFLSIDAGGRGAVVAVDTDSGAARSTHDLGRGPFAFPCGAGASELILVERAGSAEGSEAAHEVVDAVTGATLATARHAGLSPACGDGVVAWSTAKKDGTVVVRDARGTRVLRTGRAGVARPQATALVDGAPVVVARLDRGASLPPETWLVEETRARLLVAGGHVVVFGFDR